MKFIGLSTKDGVIKEKIKLTIAVSIIVALCVLSVIGINTLLDLQTKADLEKRNSELASLMTDTTSAESEVTETAALSETDNTETTATTVSTESESESETEATQATESEIESETTTETTISWSETYYQDQVYAYGTLNVRSGPGTSYDIVLTLNRGDAIDVIAVTDNGWYKTYNNNYVLAELCQTTPVTEAAPTPTPRATTAATTAPTTASTTASGGGSQISGMTYYGSCRITFYSSSELGGSTSTASGTTCSQGRTVAADWSIFPAGTVIYIANDPLGGDGYYTVEDRGSAVTGNIIDIYVNDLSSYSTTSGEVYIVN